MASIGIAATVASLTILPQPASHAQVASTINLFDGSLSSSNYHSAADLDALIGISSAGTVVYNGSSPVGAYYYYLWNGPIWHEQDFNGQHEAYVEDDIHGDVRSEGMGYAMMICVQGNDQYRFDLLYNFVKNHMCQDPDGFYNWHVTPNGSLINGDNGMAPDGDEWIVTSLIMAQHRWGGTYINDAWGKLYNFANHGGSPSMFQPDNNIVNFGFNYAPGQSDPSYVVPGFYKVWYDATGQNNSNYTTWMSWTGGDTQCWNSITTASRTYLNNSATVNQGGKIFHPDYATYSGQPSGGTSYGWDAWRTPMNAAIDATWNGQGTLYYLFCRDRQDYYYYQTPRAYSNGSTGELAMNACAGECYNWSNQERADFAQALYSASKPSHYYDGLLYFLGLLVTSGRFKYY